ncbi:hypothetical protein MBLNU459_g5394t1 [Dothideomycetes sp. NU459]
MNMHGSEKAARYIGLLNTARLNGRWSEVPELVRKVDKHAPTRKCLTLTATTEAQIAHATAERPGTGSSVTSYTGLLDITPNLVQAIDQEKNHFEDAFQANVCLHEIYFLRGEWETILGGLDNDVWQQVAQHTKTPAGLSPITRIAILKNRYFLGIAHEKQGLATAAAESYQSALKATRNVPADVSSAAEYRLWAERIVARACALQTQKGTPSTLEQIRSTLAAFRSWAHYWEGNSSAATSVSSHSRTQFDVPRREIWSQYYQLLSFILARNLIYSTSPDMLVATSRDGVPQDELNRLRLQQRTELKRVEAIYETLLLQETRFPKASQSNEEVELWTQQAMSNWNILCGPQWHESDLGEGGKAGVSRGVLDILYRAATKTFHSTAILRHLFAVHAALAEFDLAMRAFDSYSEIISKGKARAEKTGQHEFGLDTDDLVVLTAAQAINLLCKYGTRAEGEKAIDIGKKLSTWLQQQRPTSSTSSNFQSTTGSSTELRTTSTESLVSSSALLAAYRAIGEAQANWSRLTYDPAQRTEFRGKALSSLRTAAALSQPENADPESALQLAIVLAESRELIAAIQVIKRVLASSSHGQDALTLDERFARDRKLVPHWHLMSLLLTARGEFENAAKICDAAFEQFKEDAILSEQAEGDINSRTQKSLSQNLLQQLEDSEKESLLQIRITQLALTELLESSTVAVDTSSELLALYTKMFGTLDVGSTPLQRNSVATPLPPTRSGGTLKSISGSILGRSKGGRKSLDKSTFSDQPATTQATGETDQSHVSPIAIKVTNEEGNVAEKHHKHHIPHHPFKIRGHHGDWREAGNLKQQPTTQTSHELSEKQLPPVPAKDTSHAAENGGNADGLHSKPSLDAVPHNLQHDKQPPPLGHLEQPPKQDLRLPAPHPAASTISPPRFPTAQQRRHGLSLLIGVWLFIAGQYMRAELLEDAEGAMNEAQKLAEGFQQELAKEDSSARAFDERGWGGGKSVNRLWADIWAERGTLAALRNRPHEALSCYEQSVSHFPDHPAAIVGISSILLDIYEQKIPAEPQTTPIPAASIPIPPDAPPSPAQLNRLAARDRAYMLLNSVTKLGEGWDDSEAWAALARAHELSEQVERARECLWFVVELEDGRPIRPWNVVASAL